MTWDKARILRALRKRHAAGENLSYSALARRDQSLLSAAAYYFGSYRKAVEKAGIDYSQHLQRPRWTKQRIIAVIKKARRENLDLNWGAVAQRRDELGHAAFASMQKRLFGRWDRALQAAGLDADEVARYRTWDRNTVAFELRSRHQNGEALNSGAVQRDDPSLHAAAVRYFGSFDNALRAAKLDPAKHRQRRAWTEASVIAALRKLATSNGGVSDPLLRRTDPGLLGAAIRFFGSFTKARVAAGVRKQRRAQK